MTGGGAVKKGLTVQLVNQIKAPAKDRSSHSYKRLRKSAENAFYLCEESFRCKRGLSAAVRIWFSSIRVDQAVVYLPDIIVI